MRTLLFLLALVLTGPSLLVAQRLEPVTPPDQRGRIDAERMGIHDANRIRTIFYNYGMVGDFQSNPDLTVFHSAEVPKGSGLNYSDGQTPFVLARVRQENGLMTEIMMTGYRERQATSPFSGRIMRFEPRPGYFQADPGINVGRSIALSNDPRTWPTCWPDRQNDPSDPGWCGAWSGYFGKRPNADQESFSVMDDQFYDAWNFYPDERDRTRRGLGLRIEVRGFQWSNPQAQDVIFWHYDIVNESTTTYEDIIFGMYMDSGVGGSATSCDGIAESDDDNAFFTRDLGVNLVYTWDKSGRGVSLAGNCTPTGYLGYAFMETPGNGFDGVDNDNDGIRDESRDSGPGQRIVGQDAIRAHVMANYDMAKFTAYYGPLEERPAYAAGVWWTGDEDMDWVAEFHDVGSDGLAETNDFGEGDGTPTAGEPNFDQTDIDESDQIGLTGFKMNRIRAGAGAPTTNTDNIVFYNNEFEWPRRLYDMFTDPNPANRFDDAVVLNYNIGFLFASGPFRLEAGRRERFSLALAYGDNLSALVDNVRVVQRIYAANYQFATPPPMPTVQAVAGDGFVTLTWDNAAQRSIDPVTNRNDFEGYRIYRATDPNFLDVQLIRDGRGLGPLGNGRPVAQFDLDNEYRGFSNLAVQGVAYWLGDNTGLVHTWTDSSVVNGQTYYYAVTAYDHGSEEFQFYPSENPITVSRTLRGGTILPKNVVEVRPNPRVPGFSGAEIVGGRPARTAGLGAGDVAIRIVGDELVQDGHRYRINFVGLADSARAQTYTMTNLTTNQVVFEGGLDLDGEGTGPVADGLLPIIQTPRFPTVDTVRTGFTPTSLTNAKFNVRYAQAATPGVRRPGYPEDLIITFSNTFIDTSRAAVGAPAVPIRFRVTSAVTGQKLPVRFRDLNGDRTLSATGEFIEVLAPRSRQVATLAPLWRFEFAGTSDGLAVQPPQGESVFNLRLNAPFTDTDVFEFVTSAAFIDDASARDAFRAEAPYVVPNPYVAAASFEPAPFGVSGRGERRIEFRGIPTNASVRIYTLAGDLVDVLQHDGTTAGIVPWDLRSRDNLEVAPGLYFYHVDARDLGTFVGKFAVIK